MTLFWRVSWSLLTGQHTKRRTQQWSQAGLSSHGRKTWTCRRTRTSILQPLNLVGSIALWAATFRSEGRLPWELEGSTITSFTWLTISRTNLRTGFAATGTKSTLSPAHVFITSRPRAEAPGALPIISRHGNQAIRSGPIIVRYAPPRDGIASGGCFCVFRGQLLPDIICKNRGGYQLLS